MISQRDTPAAPPPLVRRDKHSLPPSSRKSPTRGEGYNPARLPHPPATVTPCLSWGLRCPVSTDSKDCSVSVALCSLALETGHTYPGVLRPRAWPIPVLQDHLRRRDRDRRRRRGREWARQRRWARRRRWWRCNTH